MRWYVGLVFRFFCGRSVWRLVVRFMVGVVGVAVVSISFWEEYVVSRWCRYERKRAGVRRRLVFFEGSWFEVGFVFGVDDVFVLDIGDRFIIRF